MRALLLRQQGCTKTLTWWENRPYLQPLTPIPWVILDQPLGHNSLSAAAQWVHAVFKVNIVLISHRMDFNLKRKNRMKISPELNCYPSHSSYQALTSRSTLHHSLDSTGDGGDQCGCWEVTPHTPMGWTITSRCSTWISARRQQGRSQLPCIFPLGLTAKILTDSKLTVHCGFKPIFYKHVVVVWEDKP